MQSNPRGVQLHLGTAQRSHIVDTLVMSNLGYFQVKAEPGMYNLTLAPGRSSELYGVVPPEKLKTLSEVKAIIQSVSVMILKNSLFRKHGLRSGFFAAIPIVSVSHRASIPALE